MPCRLGWTGAPDPWQAVLPKEGNPRGCQGENKQTLALLFPGEMSVGTGLSPGLWSLVPESSLHCPLGTSSDEPISSRVQGPWKPLQGSMGGPGRQQLQSLPTAGGPYYLRLWEPCYSEHEHLGTRIGHQASLQPPCSPPLFQPSCSPETPRDTSSVQSLSPVGLCDPMDCGTPGLPVYHQLPKFIQTHIYWVSDAIQPSHPLLSPSPPTFNLSQHQGVFKWVSSSHQVAKVLEFQLQHQSFQWIFRTDFLYECVGFGKY